MNLLPPKNDSESGIQSAVLYLLYRNATVPPATIPPRTPTSSMYCRSGTRATPAPSALCTTDHPLTKYSSEVFPAKYDPSPSNDE